MEVYCLVGDYDGYVGYDYIKIDDCCLITVVDYLEGAYYLKLCLGSM